MADRYQTGANFTGKILVAHPMLTDFFARTVILIYQDDVKLGTSGLVINKPTKLTVKAIIEDRGLLYDGTEHVYQGGPVNNEAILMLHEDGWYSSNTMQIGNGLAVTSDNLMTEKLSMHNTPRSWRMTLGMAGWAPGQLIKECNSKYGWLVGEADPSIVFDKDGERQWNKALQMCAGQKIDSYF
jgi:putative transcriptional regulator